jgi:CBS domain-containing protein
MRPGEKEARMRRVQARQAGIDEWLTGAEVIQADDEALLLEVHGGEMLLVVPAGTSADTATDQARLLRGTLHLENERVLTIEVRAHTAGAHYTDAPMALQEGRTGMPTADSGGLAGSRRAVDRPGTSETKAATAADIMTREVLTTRPEVAVRELAKRLAYHRISGMPVVDEHGAVIGVVSEADLISKRGSTVADIMTSPVIGVDEETPAVEVAALLTTERIKRVPVLRDGRLIGLIGRSNVVSWAASQGLG